MQSASRRRLTAVFGLVFASLLVAPAAAGRDTPAVRAARLAALQRLLVAVDDALILPGKVVKVDKLSAAAELEASTGAFLEVIKGTSEQLSSSLLAQIRTSTTLLRQPAEPAATAALLRAIRHGLVKELRVTAAPSQTPSFEVGRMLFAKNCASCHGETGRADGVLSAKIVPPPRSLADRATMAEVAPLRSYLLINAGRPGSAMPAYRGKLTTGDMWSLAFYVATLQEVPPASAGDADAAWARVAPALRARLMSEGLSLTLLATHSDAELREKLRPVAETSQPLVGLDALVATLRRVAPYVRSVPRE